MVLYIQIYDSIEYRHIMSCKIFTSFSYAYGQKCNKRFGMLPHILYMAHYFEM